MADLSPENKRIINHLKDKLLDILNEAKKVEFLLLQRFGENLDTYDSLEQLTEISEQARTRFTKLSNLQIHIAESQPEISSSLLQFIHQAIVSSEVKIPALEQSIKEIKTDWNL
ncbi:hypothetical protein [Cyanobacterium aponinum]|uniref:Uncharacterized protein n=1 Tax=Cyanobacterium aponinum (strain PCC 10605) TaxID=755178 RepID=K9Z2N4_CYAAP|nr:hypothetical protein [Cyanobacterium aponinum]AFZ52633.1 hypothetical protein Cyan10605_0491 [Cyanobacterium aponinum PCC 10605]